MSTYRELCRVTVTHTYYNGICRDFEFFPTADTVRMLDSMGMRAKVIDDTLYIVYETDGSNLPKYPILSSTLRFGMRIKNPYFMNFTDVPAGFIGNLRNYQVFDYNYIDVESEYILVGNKFEYTIQETSRPVNVRLYDPTSLDKTISAVTLTDAGQKTVSFDASAWPSGVYLVKETSAAATHDTGYHIEQELYNRGAVVAIEMYIDSFFFIDPIQHFEIPFTAKTQVLNYYVVASNYSAPELATVTIADGGAGDDGRPQVQFKRIEQGSFTVPAELPLDTLISGSDRIVLFRSASGMSDLPIPRRVSGRSKIQLSKNGDMLFTNLPGPGPERTDSDMIIHISKP